MRITLAPEQRVTSIRFARDASCLCAVTGSSDPASAKPQSLLALGFEAGDVRQHRLPIPHISPFTNPGVRPGYLHDAAMSPDGRLIAIHVGRDIVLLGAGDGKVVHQVDAGIAGCRELEFDRTGSLVASVCSLQWPPLVTYHLKSGAVRHFEPPAEMEYSASMPRLSVAGEGTSVAMAPDAGSALLWDTVSGQLRQRLELPGLARSIESELDRAIPAWRIWTRRFCRRLQFALDGKHLGWICSPMDMPDFSKMGAWSVATDGTSTPAMAPIESSMSAASFNPDLSLLACPVFGAPDEIGIWDILHRSLLMTLRHDLGGVHDIRFSPDGRWLALGGGGALILHRVHVNAWAERPDCCLWRLRIGDASATTAVGAPAFVSRFAEIPGGDALPFDQLMDVASKLCEQKGSVDPG